MNNIIDEELKQRLQIIENNSGDASVYESLCYDLVHECAELKKEIERLKEIEWMYNDLNK